MRWFMSYVTVYPDGRFQFGACSYEGDEHPLEKADRWMDQYKKGESFTFQIIVTSFQRVDYAKDYDRLSWSVGGDWHAG